jgi:hypothetical protein
MLHVHRREAASAIGRQNWIHYCLQRRALLARKRHAVTLATIHSTPSQGIGMSKTRDLLNMPVSNPGFEGQAHQLPTSSPHSLDVGAGRQAKRSVQSCLPVSMGCKISC